MLRGCPGLGGGGKPPCRWSSTIGTPDPAGGAHRPGWSRRIQLVVATPRVLRCGWASQLGGDGGADALAGCHITSSRGEREFWREIVQGLLHRQRRRARQLARLRGVGSRWFSCGGGMQPFALKVVTSRYAFAEREETPLRGPCGCSGSRRWERPPVPLRLGHSLLWWERVGAGPAKRSAPARPRRLPIRQPFWGHPDPSHPNLPRHRTVDLTSLVEAELDGLRWNQFLIGDYDLEGLRGAGPYAQTSRQPSGSTARLCQASCCQRMSGRSTRTP